MNPDNVIELFHKERKEPEHKEYTACIGEIEFNDPAQTDVDFEVRALAAPNSIRYWIVVEGDTAQFYGFHKASKFFPAGAQIQLVRQWVRDEIQKEYGKARVTIV